MYKGGSVKMLSFCEHKPPFLLSTIPVDAVEVISKVVVNSVTFYTVKHHLNSKQSF